MRCRRSLLVLLVFASACALAPVAGAQTQEGDGWPPELRLCTSGVTSVCGLLLINKDDSNRPLDARPGRDPFMGEDPTYRCDTEHTGGPRCAGRLRSCGDGRKCVKPGIRHNELLGGHGDDRIVGGPGGDVLWADYKPTGRPRTQVDRIWGGRGRDFIYGGQGTNRIRAGGGNDFVKSRYGRGTVDCGPGNDVLYFSRRARRAKSYQIRRCERIRYGPSPAQR